MSTGTREANRLLKSYGKKLFDAHAEYLYTANTPAPAHSQTRYRKSARRIAIVFAALILIMALTLAVCNALGIQLFNFHFDKQQGFTIIKSMETEKAPRYYKALYVAKGYEIDPTVIANHDFVIYDYKSVNEDKYYTISEGTNKNSIWYVDSDGYKESKEVYGEYELYIYMSTEGLENIVLFEKDKTYISIIGNLSIEEFHAIIDSLVPVLDIT